MLVHGAITSTLDKHYPSFLTFPPPYLECHKSKVRRDPTSQQPPEQPPLCATPGATLSTPRTPTRTLRLVADWVADVPVSARARTAGLCSYSFGSKPMSSPSTLYQFVPIPRQPLSALVSPQSRCMSDQIDTWFVVLRVRPRASLPRGGRTGATAAT